MMTHNKDCELGDNWKDCPACIDATVLAPTAKGVALHVLGSGRERRIAEAAKTMRACKARMEDAETKADEWRRAFADAKLKYEAACSATDQTLPTEGAAKDS